MQTSAGVGQDTVDEASVIAVAAISTGHGQSLLVVCAGACGRFPGAGVLVVAVVEVPPLAGVGVEDGVVAAVRAAVHDQPGVNVAIAQTAPTDGDDVGAAGDGAGAVAGERPGRRTTVVASLCAWRWTDGHRAGIGCQGDQSTGSPSQRGGKSWARRFRLHWVTVDHRPRIV
ncbi:MAG: hypothetical protein DI630_06835 [Gordonia sp. (in: high G+C Gram-positive bacteria)]|nr:MAG: hypothetical protein DI630_06835 [Gordonia sp. (in: high G+C Gram-positive bacteria)]